MKITIALLLMVCSLSGAEQRTDLITVCPPRFGYGTNVLIVFTGPKKINGNWGHYSAVSKTNLVDDWSPLPGSQGFDSRDDQRYFWGVWDNSIGFFDVRFIRAFRNQVGYNMLYHWKGGK